MGDPKRGIVGGFLRAECRISPFAGGFERWSEFCIHLRARAYKMIDQSDDASNSASDRTSGFIAERRTHVRVDLEVPAMVDSARTWERCRCTNLSEGGLALHASSHFDVGDTVDVYFELPGGAAIETASQVVSVRGDCVHVRFTRLTGEQRLNVFRYVVAKRPPRRRLAGAS